LLSICVFNTFPSKWWYLQYLQWKRGYDEREGHRNISWGVSFKISLSQID